MESHNYKSLKFKMLTQNVVFSLKECSVAEKPFHTTVKVFIVVYLCILYIYMYSLLKQKTKQKQKTRTEVLPNKPDIHNSSIIRYTT